MDEYDDYARSLGSQPVSNVHHIDQPADDTPMEFDPALAPQRTGSWASIMAMSAARDMDNLEALANCSDYVLDDIVPTGTTALFYGKPNAGKTLIILGMIIQALLAGTLSPDKLIYINEDDGLGGYYNKAKIAKRYGFTMISSMRDPSDTVSNTDDVLAILEGLTKEPECNGAIFIVDTLKKYCPVMDKPRTKAFFVLLRKLNNAGATVILLGHANKHLVNEKLVFEGVQDVNNDIDIMYSLYNVSEREDPVQSVVVENEKDRGAVAMKFTVSYRKTSDTDYDEMLKSVTVEGPDVAEKSAAKRRVQDAVNNRADEWLFIKTAMGGVHGLISRPELVERIAEAEQNPNGFTMKQIDTTLKQLTKVGLLTKKTDKSRNNMSIYRVAEKWREVYP